MRLHHPDSTTIHLAYCTNVYPAETLDGITAQLTGHAEQVRRHLDTDLVGLGLWLPADVAHHLAAHPDDTEKLRRTLTARGLETVTLNGFPYRGFHTPVVKRGVYFPDWSEPSRLTYTLNLARVLAALLPQDAARGSISTLPLAWRTPWTGVQRSTAARHLDDLAAGLKQIEAETGRTIRVGLEPEPGCVAETTAQAAHAIAGADHDWIGLCLDACHLAVQHEDPHDAVAALTAAGVPVVKLQASSALVADTPADPESRRALHSFTEPRFLHQVREQLPDGTLRGCDDLAPALAGALPGHAPWRIHYHVPLHDQPEPPLRNTSDALQETLRATLGGPHALTDHVEVETYTWDVLPPGLRPTGAPGIAAGIATELEWTHGELTRLGLTEHPGATP
ncbi:metabolite traffic protein EboE [Streptomyces sp. ML-6]|uniref:metabolite traffic protein EboE n=1 Tax=Streptomyces sp. ML-6 TaxID=2982693 RepID=UPI0024BF7C75|nr:metabolite traffic protein EboE [Streptomyces sp. ML-6]MDK0524949.1 metabolite traffic protein EboE [Streptomyces sp. ML-6]